MEEIVKALRAAWDKFNEAGTTVQNARALGQHLRTIDPASGQPRFGPELAQYGNELGEQTDPSNAALNFGPGILAGKSARFFPHKQAEAAIADLITGRAPEYVWQKHGITQGPKDSKLRFEIPDQGVRIQGPKDFGSEAEGTVGEFISHPELYRQYPEIADWGLYGRIGKDETGAGHFSNLEGYGPGVFATGRNEEEFLSTLLHEIQHGVQNMEGFPRGANYKTVTDAIVQGLRDRLGRDLNSEELVRAERSGLTSYGLSAGEVEARNVEKRLRNSEKFNKTVHPWITQDTPAELQQFTKDLPGYRK